jgi:hypothetical protein
MGDSVAEKHAIAWQVLARTLPAIVPAVAGRSGPRAHGRAQRGRPMNPLVVRTIAGILAAGVTTAGLAGIEALAASGALFKLPVVVLPAVEVTASRTRDAAHDRASTLRTASQGERWWAEPSVVTERESPCRC